MLHAFTCRHATISPPVDRSGHKGRRVAWQGSMEKYGLLHTTGTRGDENWNEGEEEKRVDEEGRVRRVSTWQPAAISSVLSSGPPIAQFHLVCPSSKRRAHAPVAPTTIFMFLADDSAYGWYSALPDAIGLLSYIIPVSLCGARFKFLIFCSP